MSSAEVGMPPAAMKYLLTRPKVAAPLDPNFSPLVLAKKNYLKFVAGSPHFVEWVLPRSDGAARYKLPVFADSHDDVEASIYLAAVLIQDMLWQRSASGLLLSGPKKICDALKAAYSVGGTYEFEVLQMPKVCGTPDKPFTTEIVPVERLPPAFDTPQVCGTVANGCRLAFDLGKSDIKTVAVKDDEVLYSKETEWDVTNPDPDYHYTAIRAALEKAKKCLPKVDAVGGSATGTISGNNEATWCDVFPNVPPDVYKEKVVDIFSRLSKELAGDVPLKVINDGEVTALAAFQKIGMGNIMGISMGSSEGGGYCNTDGNLMGWINELCYCRLDLNPEAPTDPWSKGSHRGLSHMYLGQRGATKLAAKVGVKLPPNYVYPHPDMCTIKHEDHAQCLKLVQKAMVDPEQEANVAKLYITIGVYLGYALAQYSEFYPIDHVMILGRVSKGKGGDIMLDTAKKVLMEEFPKYAHITFHTADDHFKAVGQCIAAAALPKIREGMPASAAKYLVCTPKVQAPLDPGFAPVVLGRKKYTEAVKGCTGKLDWALPRSNGCGRYSLPVFPDDHPDVEASVYVACNIIQEMIWQRSASGLMLAGPQKICEATKKAFSKGGMYEFEVMQMPKVCGTPDKPFTVTIVTSVSDLPAGADTPETVGKDVSGNRLAFDLGKSDIKTVAVKDGDVLYSKETEWDVTHPDPQYHFDAVLAALKAAKKALPGGQVDAVGGSATGTLGSNNEATWCDLFPNVPPALYKEKVVDIFSRIVKELAGNVPLKVINDGEVTAVAAAQKIKAGNVFGISLGSSEGGGYANGEGNLMGWINEMAYIKIDFNPDALTNPWDGGNHTGCAHMYLGQRAASRFAAVAGVKNLPGNYVFGHPDTLTIKHDIHAQCLKLVQKAMQDPTQEPQVRKIYETVGVYLGYAIAQYKEFYAIDHVMILGRVPKGHGGDIMLGMAKRVLETEFADLSPVQFHTADDHFKAVGQCIAAAALPKIG